jgi:hypothetical protein
MIISPKSASRRRAEGLFAATQTVQPARPPADADADDLAEQRAMIRKGLQRTPTPSKPAAGG